MNKKEILLLFNQYKIEERLAEFIENDDKTMVNYYGDIHFDNLNIKEIPIQFNYVFGSFYCHNNQLQNLKNSPLHVENTFDCSYNKLKSLRYGPKTVGDYICNNNVIESFFGISKKINGHFFCYENNLKNFNHFPEVVDGACLIFNQTDTHLLDRFNFHNDLLDIFDEVDFLFWKNISEEEKNIKIYKKIIQKINIKNDINHKKIKI